MAVNVVSFRWLEILEKEFDKNFVDLDLLIGDFDAEEPDFVYSARQKLAGLSSCFAQLTHKAQTIFQNSAKLEAELVDMRTELVNSKTRQGILEEDSRNLVLQLHSLQLDRLPSNQNPEQYKEKIETALKLSPFESVYSEEITFRNLSEIKKLKNELVQYQSENIILRNSILALHSEVYGARLAAKYLDKELAGRIQQLQLLGKEMRTDVRDKLWRQLESEILLHRHKTVIRACRNRTNHKIIPTDSGLFNFIHSNGRYFKNEYNLRLENSPLKFDSNMKHCKNYYYFENSKKHSKSIEELHQSVKGVVSNNCLEYTNFKDNDLKECNYQKEKDYNKQNNVLVADTSELNMNMCNKEITDISLSETNDKIKEKKDEEKKPENEDLKREFQEGKKQNKSLDNDDILCAVGERRTVIVKRELGQGLGISITGGREHGVPILISELEVGGPAHESKSLFVGDAILKVNDISLENTSHFEAVKILTSLDTNNVKLVVQFIAVDTDEENSLSEDLYGYRYRFFDAEVMDSSDALSLHPLHSNSAHTSTIPLTPDFDRNDRNEANNQYEQLQCSTYNKTHANEVVIPQNQSDEEFNSSSQANQNLIDIDPELEKENNEKLKIDLFGFRFQTNMNDVATCSDEGLLDDFLVKKSEDVKAEGDLIQIEVTELKPSVKEKKFEYVDENIFSGLEDHSLLDNIVKSFSEDDFSYVEAEKEKNINSDSGLEVCLSSSDLDAEKLCLEEQSKENNSFNDWVDNPTEKVELKTLQQIFDRSFSSNLSSPRGSTSFDDDILSTEHSDEKSNSVKDFKNKTRDAKNVVPLKKNQKFNAKFAEGVEEDILKKSLKSEGSVNSKNELLNGKKAKRNGCEVLKRNKAGRKLKENIRKDLKVEKKKNLKELETDLSKLKEMHKKRGLIYKMTDRFEENLIEYVKSYEISETTTGLIGNCLETFDSDKKKEFLDNMSDELEETRKLSRKYGLKIPGKGVKTEMNNVQETKTPEPCMKVVESHLKHFKPVLEGSLKINEKIEGKSKGFRFNRYDSFGDPDFGTPV